MIRTSGDEGRTGRRRVRRQVAVRAGDRAGAARRRRRARRPQRQGPPRRAARRPEPPRRPRPRGSRRRLDRRPASRSPRCPTAPGSEPRASAAAPSSSPCAPISRSSSSAATSTRGSASSRPARSTGSSSPPPACARLGRESEIAFRFGLRALTPAPGQGSLGARGRVGDEPAAAAAAAVTDREALIELTAERAVVAGLDASCDTPVGVCARAWRRRARDPRLRRPARRQRARLRRGPRATPTSRSRSPRR